MRYLISGLIAASVLAVGAFSAPVASADTGCVVTGTHAQHDVGQGELTPIPMDGWVIVDYDLPVEFSDDLYTYGNETVRAGSARDAQLRATGEVGPNEGPCPQTVGEFAFGEHIALSFHGATGPDWVRIGGDWYQVLVAHGLLEPVE